MRLISYQSDAGSRVAAVREDGYVDLNRADRALPTSLKALLEAGDAALARAAAAAARGEAIAPASVKLLAPIPDPQKVICIGLNYADHARESKMEPPSEPVVFSKFATAVAAHGDPIVLPHDSQEVDYEAELVAIIGRRARRVSRASALDYVAGYCPGHDVSARDWQLRKPGGQWLLGKSFDTFAPFGPALVTPDEVGDPGQLKIRLRLNGAVMQDSSTSQFIFGIAELVEYLSRVTTLVPGDVIFTGTPPGVGAARKPQVFMQPGDVAEVEVEKLGVLRNPVVAEAGK